MSEEKRHSSENIKAYGQNIYVRRIPPEPGEAPQYNVLKGSFCVKVFANADEADAYAKKLARPK